MEIREILSHFVNSNTSFLDVDFRLLEDSEEVIRTDSISFQEIKDFGFDFIDNSFNDKFLDEDDDYLGDDDDFMFGFDESVDTDEIKSFLDEYYMVYPDRLPKAEII